MVNLRFMITVALLFQCFLLAGCLAQISDADAAAAVATAEARAASLATDAQTAADAAATAVIAASSTPDDVAAANAADVATQLADNAKEAADAAAATAVSLAADLSIAAGIADQSLLSNYKCYKGGTDNICCDNDGYGPTNCRKYDNPDNPCASNSLNSNIPCNYTGLSELTLDYKCFKGGINNWCCNNDGYGPLCKSF